MPEEDTPKNQPKLLQHKPSKAQVKKAKASAMDSSSGSSGPVSGSTAPPLAPKKSFLRRTVPFFLAANLAVGAYVLLRTTDRKSAVESDKLEEAPVAPVTTEGRSDESKKSDPQCKPSTASAPAPIKVLTPIPEDEQRKLFKWILDEKRKIKSTSPSEKKKIDEEKAILKRYIRNESLPSI